MAGREPSPASATPAAGPVPPSVGEGLAAPVGSMHGVGKVRAAQLARLGAASVADLLLFVPRDYHDLRSTVRVADAVDGKLVRVRVQLEKASSYFTKAGVPVVRAAFMDGRDILTVEWFRRPDVGDRLRLGATYELTGKVRASRGRRRMDQPKIEAVDDDARANLASAVAATLLPVYPLTDGLPLEAVRGLVRQALAKYADQWPERLPEEFRRPRGLVDAPSALRRLHFPTDRRELLQALQRL
ncbi:MAG: hypothetical protein ACRDD1_21825, partial [Planctomycetia bacterium]